MGPGSPPSPPLLLPLALPLLLVLPLLPAVPLLLVLPLLPVVPLLLPVVPLLPPLLVLPPLELPLPLLEPPLEPLEPPDPLLPPSSPTLLLDEPEHATGIATAVPSDATKRTWIVFMRHLLDPREIHKSLGHRAGARVVSRLDPVCGFVILHDAVIRFDASCTRCAGGALAR
jgi:hypothetical protein